MHKLPDPTYSMRSSKGIFLPVGIKNKPPDDPEAWGMKLALAFAGVDVAHGQVGQEGAYVAGHSGDLQLVAGDPLQGNGEAPALSIDMDSAA